MAKKSTKNISLDLSSDWDYAPAPESTGHINLKKKYDLLLVENS